MSNVIELNFAEIDTVVGGTNRRTPPEVNVNRQAMALPNMALAAGGRTSPSASKPDNSALLARIDALG